MSDEDIEVGDEAAHGEEAYAIWGQGERLENSNYNDIEIQKKEKKKGSKKDSKKGGSLEMA